MSKLNKIRGAQAPHAQAKQLFGEQIKNGGASFVGADTTNNLISMESLNGAQAQNLVSAYEEMQDTIRQTLQGVGLEGFDDVGLQAGAVAAMAAGNPAAYAEQAYNGRASADGATLVDPVTMGDAGAIDTREVAALEAFDDRELREHLPTSIVFNVYGARQDEFAEAFYPTVVVTPDQAGLDVSVSRMLVFSEVRRATGAAANFNKKNLIDAAVDATILADEHTALVPARLSDNSNASFFVPSTLVASYFKDVAGVAVPTAPLAMGKTVDLIGISQYQPLIGAGILDSTDSLDARIVLQRLILQVAAGEAGVAFNVERLPRASFVKSVEGNYREMNLQFATQDLVINAGTRQVDGSTVAEFADITSNNYTVRLSVAVNGTANVEIGNVKLFASAIEVASITDASGNLVSTAGGAGATIKAALEAMTIAGYELKAARTNANRRTRGLILDTTVETERYTIPLGSPISVPSPASSNRDAADLKALIAASRIRNSNNAVTTLLNSAASLKAYLAGPKRKDALPQVGGIGRFLVEPFFEEHDLDLELSINSIKSHEKAADVSAVLINAIRDVSYRMYRDSRYRAALDALTAGTGAEPTLVVGTDEVLVRHLMVDGDTRTFGAGFKSFEIVASKDRRVANKIFITFRRDEAKSAADALSFGTHAWIPELASTIVVSRNGATTKETMVQPRSLHVTHLPILAQINVQNLSKVLADRIDQPAVATDVTNPYLAGLTTPVQP